MTMSAAAAHAVFWSVVQPANVAMMRWPLDAIPQNGVSWRNRWEYGHAVRAYLVTTALGALTWSVLQEARTAETSDTAVSVPIGTAHA